MDQAIYDKVDEFFKHYALVRIKRGQAVYGAEQEIPDIYWLRHGKIRLYQITEDGAEITMHIFTAPSFFPMMFYLGKRRADYYFQATEDVIARKAPAKEVVAFLQQNPDVLFDLTRRFADAITGLLLRIEQLSSQTALERICSILLYLDKQFGRDHSEGRQIQLKLRHDDIAAWAGVARETASRQLEKLTNAKLITVSRHYFVILDRQGLEAKLK